MKFKILLPLLICVFFFNTVYSQYKMDKKLQRKVETLVQDFKGDVGIYIHDLKKDKIVAINADTIFPTASVVKIPILVGVFDQIEQGKLTIDDKYFYRESQVYGGSGLMQFFKDSTEIDVHMLVALMMSVSDNVASIWCQQLAGGGTHINELMEGLGLKSTYVNSRTDGREDIWKKYGWGQTTPREMAHLLTMICQGKVISQKASDDMHRYLGNMLYTTVRFLKSHLSADCL